jgi:hypothetical protein
MSIKLEDLVHAACSQYDWQINVPDGWCTKTVYQGDIDKMPLDVYFSVKDMYVRWFGEWDWSGTEEQRVFQVCLTFDSNSESTIVQRYNDRKEREERLKGYQTKINDLTENKNE